MESHPGFCSTVVELDVQWRHVSLESEPRRGLISAEGIVDRIVLITHGKLSTNSDILILRQVFRDPSCKAMRVAIIASLAVVFSTVQVTEEVPSQIVSTLPKFKDILDALLTFLLQDYLGEHPCPLALSRPQSSLQNRYHLCLDVRRARRNSSSPNQVASRRY